MKSAEIRQAYLSFFESKGHTILPSSSLVPGNDPTLLFTNAGMVQFKDVFLGADKRPYNRATSSQRCVRAGGKHNDLENVGYTARHHTFFEMLGNFSFGDYFKHDAIRFAWEFLTEVLKLPAERLWVTVHISDDEAADIWAKEVGVDPSRLSRLDEDNFWQMGDTGPCGPSTEIFYDHGEHVPGGPPGSENDDLDRYIEIWNLVFMQYERQVGGELQPLPKPSVDTGMGLERVAAVMQNVHSNYEIDLFQALLKAAQQATGAKNAEDKSLRVIADHIRSCAFLICDGVMPSNEGRGYVLRRIIRRAVRHGHKLGRTLTFFHKLVPALVEQMGEAYPELLTNQAQLKKVLLTEEEQFAVTLDKGLAVLDDKLKGLKGKVIPGDIVFTLYDTYGFPVDLTNDIARERGLSLDAQGYEALMEKQRARSKASGTFKADYTHALQLEGETRFAGYKGLEAEGQVLAILKEGHQAEILEAGEEGAIVLDHTAFYAESGGQVGDSGYLHASDARFEVHDCQKHGQHHLHVGVLVEGQMKGGDTLSSVVDASVRQAVVLNHSATHLLHAALREVLGSHVTQKGSLVDAQRLRFDFSHFEGVSADQLLAIEDKVNEQIRLNSAVHTELCDMETAQEKGAMALFGEKYGDQVRVLTMGDGFSVELCGGTHASHTGDIGVFRIVSEAGIASGVRRIEAVTGQTAIDVARGERQALADAALALKAQPETLSEKIQALLGERKALEKSVADLQSKMASASAGQWVSDAKDINGLKVLAKVVPGADAKALRTLLDELKSKLETGVILLAASDGEKVALAAGVTKSATSLIKAGDVMRHAANELEGKGGGRPDMAQGSGKDNGRLNESVAQIQSWIEQQISIN